MGWAEELESYDEDATVEIRFPAKYVEYSIQGMKRYSAGISHLCKGAALLGDTETEFLVYDMTVMQAVTIKEVMARFGIAIEYECGKLPDGTRWVYFYADLHGLIEKMKEGELDGVA